MKDQELLEKIQELPEFADLWKAIQNTDRRTRYHDDVKRIKENQSRDTEFIDAQYSLIERCYSLSKFQKQRDFTAVASELIRRKGELNLWQLLHLRLSQVELLMCQAHVSDGGAYCGDGALNSLLYYCANVAKWILALELSSVQKWLTREMVIELILALGRVQENSCDQKSRKVIKEAAGILWSTFYTFEYTALQAAEQTRSANVRNNDAPIKFNDALQSAINLLRTNDANFIFQHKLNHADLDRSDIEAGFKTLGIDQINEASGKTVAEYFPEKLYSGHPFLIVYSPNDSHSSLPITANSDRIGATNEVLRILGLWLTKSELDEANGNFKMPVQLIDPEMDVTLSERAQVELAEKATDSHEIDEFNETSPPIASARSTLPNANNTAESMIPSTPDDIGDVMHDAMIEVIIKTYSVGDKIQRGVFDKVDGDDSQKSKWLMAMDQQEFLKHNKKKGRGSAYTVAKLFKKPS